MPLPWKSVWPAALVLTLIAAHTGGWHWAASEARSAFKEQQKHRAVKAALTCSNEAWSGYPFRLELDCPDPVLYLGRGRTKVVPKALTAFVRAPFLRTIVVELAGPIVIDNDKLAAPIEIAKPEVTVEIVIESMNTLRGETDLSAVVIRQAGKERARAKSARLKGVFARGGQNELNVAVDLAGLALRPTPEEEVFVDAVTGSMQADNVPIRPAGDAGEWMKAAAELATQFNIEQLEVTYGDTRLTAKGVMHIKASGYLDGALKTRVSQLESLLNKLQAREVLSASKAKAAGTLLGLFDRGNGVAADLRFKDGELFWGPVKLGRHPVLF